MRNRFLRMCDCHRATTSERRMELDDLNALIYGCRRCRLWKGAKHAVPGEGPHTAKLMLVGQNPGKEEDETGKPFVGRAGKFLNKVLAENGINRGEVIVTNIVKHTSPRNRTPFKDEVEACLPYLKNQLEIVKPQVVVLMGKVAWQTPRLNGIEYIETVHPSAAMRFTNMRKRFLEDFAALKTRSGT